MCLTPEFFDAREAPIREREAACDIEIETVLKPRHISIDRLYEFGLLVDTREYFPTADFFIHQITSGGRRFMDTDDDHQLIFVRRDDGAGLATFLNHAKRLKVVPKL